MLPSHRPPPAIEHLSKLRHSKSCFSSNRIPIRWAVLACTILVSLYFAMPVVNHVFWPPEHFANFPHAPHLGTSRPDPPPPPSIHEQAKIWTPRKKEVKETFQRAWQGYRTIAYPDDELSSVSGTKSNKFNGWGVTLFDSLSTMWLMGLRDEFEEAIESVKDFKFDKPQVVPFFETVIRYLGGSLSAYALSGNQDILTFADKLGQALLPAFNTSSGLPSFSVNVQTGDIIADGVTLFAEAASCQLEYKYLAKVTGRKEYYESVQKVMDVLYKSNPKDGLFSLTYWRATGEPALSYISAGSMADSAYEYFLKQWIMAGDQQAKMQYIKSANGIIKDLVYVTPNRKLMYAGDLVDGYFDHRYQHLTCYLPGMLMLGATILHADLTGEERERHKWVAQGLTYTCYISYMDQMTHLGPEIMRMVPGTRWVDELANWEAAGRIEKPPGLSEPPAEKDKSKRDYSNSDAKYMLRPETVESIYYMWKFTGDVKWRNRGYEIYLAIEEHTRTEFGYASIIDVDRSDFHHMDDMPSFFLAETLKYLYLLFDDKVLDLEAWVFNTEAHPLPVFSWTEAEKAAFNIPSFLNKTQL